jgi:hypothetical protein
MIQPGFLDSESRQDLTESARDGLAAHRLARRANALVLLDHGMSYLAVANVLLLDDDTVRTWHRLYEDEGIEGLANFGYEGSVPFDRTAAGQAEGLARRDTAADDLPGWCPDRARMRYRLSEPVWADRAAASAGHGASQTASGVEEAGPQQGGSLY